MSGARTVRESCTSRVSPLACLAWPGYASQQQRAPRGARRELRARYDGRGDGIGHFGPRLLSPCAQSAATPAGLRHLSVGSCAALAGHMLWTAG
eukprot:15468466-Alexandrium_andersonii.AAC.1